MALVVNEFPFGTSQLGKRDYLFSISVCPGNFSVGRTKKSYQLHLNRNFREFVVNGKQPQKRYSRFPDSDVPNRNSFTIYKFLEFRTSFML